MERTFFSVGGNGSVDFAGLRRDEGIASIVINVPRTDFMAIDDFIFEPITPANRVSEPPLLLLLLTGLLGLVTGVRKSPKFRVLDEPSTQLKGVHL